MRFGRQFSLRHLLLLMVVAAIAVLVYQRFIYVHPAHLANPLYEKSPPIAGGRVRIGTCELSIRTVARTNRNGTILVEDGLGKPLNAKVGNANVLKQSASWLDTTQIEFDVVGGQVDMHGFRIFDHELRTIIDDMNGARGVRRVDDDTIQLYGLGNKLPDQVDVFMRVRAYEPSNKPAKLDVRAGATCNAQDGVVRVEKVLRGMISYTLEDGFKTSPEREQENTFVLLGFDGEQWPHDVKYEFCLVTKEGERIQRDRWFRFPGGYLMPDGTRLEGFNLDWNLDEIDYLEIRPLGEYQRFFFDGLQIPKTTNSQFRSPPNPILQFDGESEVKVTELSPLDVSFRLMRGDAVSGTISSGQDLRFSFYSEPKDVITETTLVGRVDGIKDMGWDLLLTPQVSRFGAHQSSGGGRWMGAFNYRIPIEEVQQLKIQMPAPLPVGVPR